MGGMAATVALGWRGAFAAPARMQRGYADTTWWDPYVENITDTYLRRKFRQDVTDKTTGVGVEALKKIAGCMACEYCHGKGNGACVQKDDMQELYPLLAEADVLVLAAPIYYFTLSAQIQAPIQRIYNMNKPGKLGKTALLMSSYSPNVYDGAIGEYRGIINYWGVEDTGIVTAKIDEQKTDATRTKILQLV